ncbi:MAG: VanZ family protein [Clostridia bacterium]
MKKKVFTGCVWALIITQLLFIFSMSAQSGSTSGQLSARVTRAIARITTPNFSQLPGLKQNRIVRKYHRYVRKSAHLLEYALLAMLLTLALRKMGLRGALTSVCACVLLAMLDETRQMFSGGRSPLATDVLIDSLGAGLGALSSFGVIWLRKRRKPRANSA